MMMTEMADGQVMDDVIRKLSPGLGTAIRCVGTGT